MSFDPDSLAPRQSLSYDVFSLTERPDILDEHQKIGGAAWPEFMLHDPVPGEHWGTLMKYFPQYQLSLLKDEEIIAVINTVPLYFDKSPQELPDRGVDWGVEKSVNDYENGKVPNTLMGMQIVVRKSYRGLHLSSKCVSEMIGLANQQRCSLVILPVRPNQKRNFPLITMEQYAKWKDGNNLPYDRWLRVHTRLGGKLIRVCSQSMIIPGTVAEWTRWTEMEFPGSGKYIVPGALNPIEIDIENDQGIYREPNVWVVHSAA